MPRPRERCWNASECKTDGKPDVSKFCSACAAIPVDNHYDPDDRAKRRRIWKEKGMLIFQQARRGGGGKYIIPPCVPGERNSTQIPNIQVECWERFSLTVYTAAQIGAAAQHNTAQPQHSQPPQRRSPARCCVKLPLAQSEPAPSYTRSAATGSGPSRAQYRAWAGAASPERVRRSREAAIRRPATMSRRLAAASEPEGRVFGSAFSGRHKQKGASE